MKNPSKLESPRKRHARSMSVSRVALGALVVVVLLIGFAIGFLAGFLSSTPGQEEDDVLDHKEGKCPPGVPEDILSDRDNMVLQKVMEEQKADNIHRYLRELTEKPHLAGTKEDFSSAENLTKFWKEIGFDKAKIIPYDVLLSYPDPDRPNRVELYDRRDKLVFTTKLEEPDLGPQRNRSDDVVPPFNAYSASGNPKGDIVYVNYGREEDFQWLLDAGINVSGKICIARYGKVFRGSKARAAEKFGAVGLILYTDPADYGNPHSNSTYPDSWWMPGTGVQRGSLMSVGDPLTPGYPAIDSAHRIPENQANLPKIPVHPIGYSDAEVLLKRMAGKKAPASWKGKLPITYKLGPGFSERNMKVQIKVFTRNNIATTYNAIGIIRGSIEPDRYVLIGNHRDAWVYGAVDPSSATAVIMEQSRALAEQMKSGWRPRRSIMFCSWGAEEYGLIGSTEWVEQHSQILGDRTVGLVNIDTAVSGNFTFNGKGMPLAHGLMYDVAKKVPNPDKKEISRGKTTLYQTWSERTSDGGEDGGKPNIPLLGSGSDFAPFVSTVGITSIDINFMPDPELVTASYPLYHTRYETFQMVEKFIDPSFEYHLAVSRFGLEYALRLADSLILPYDVTDYARTIQHYLQLLEAANGQVLRSRSIEKEVYYLQKAADEFNEAAQQFKLRLSRINKADPLAVRQVNDQMLNVERAFIDPLGIPGQPLYRHIIYAPSQYNTFSGTFFPGLVDTLHEAERATTDSAAKWDKVREHLSVMAFFIDAAASVLKPVTDF